MNPQQAKNPHRQDADATERDIAFQAMETHRQDAQRDIAFQAMKPHRQDAQRDIAFQAMETHRQDADATPTSRITKRQGGYLPHWTAGGATYAVTFRLADSLPQKVLAGWLNERATLAERAAAQGRELTEIEIAEWNRLHSERVEAYLDAGHGACPLRNPAVAQMVTDALLHFDGQRYDLLAWVVMPNHVHAVVWPYTGHELAEILHSWKSYTANQANRMLGGGGKFWMKETYDHLIRDEQDFRHAVEYVLGNPGRIGLADWVWVGAKPEAST